MHRSSNTAFVVRSVGGFVLLAVVFIVFRVTHVIDWLWVFVLAPVWAPMVSIGLGVLIATLMARRDRRRDELARDTWAAWNELKARRATR